MEPKIYVAIQNFSIPIEGKDAISVSRGEEIKYDGVTAIIRDIKVSNRSLQSVIGEWIVEKSKYKEAMSTSGSKLATPSRNATGGRIIENNDPSYDIKPRVGSRKSDDLQTLLNEYESKRETIIEDGEKDILKANKENKKYEVYEDLEVKKIKENKKEEKNEKNVSSVKEKSNISRENVVVKETKSEKNSVKNVPKKLKVDKEATGVVVKETNFEKAAKKDEVKKDKVKEEKKEVVSTEVEVKEVKEDFDEKQEVSSSTASILRKKVIVEDPMEGAVVVSKVTKDKEDKKLVDKEGVVSKLQVGKGEKDLDSIIIDDEASIESNDDIDLSDLLD